MSKITIFSDGAAKGNPGPGGYGAVISDGNKVREIGGELEKTTNNETELKAVVEAIKEVKEESADIHIYTDSKYVVEGATGWILGDEKWLGRQKQGTDVLNKKLWQELVTLLQSTTIEWHKIPGHSGLIGNERADAIASTYGEKKPVSLFDEPQSEYPYDIENITFDTKVEAAARSETRKRQAMKAHSYVSEINGDVQTHKTWKECEARVKGKKARFKKAISAEEERSIIAAFSS